MAAAYDNHLSQNPYLRNGINFIANVSGLTWKVCCQKTSLEPRGNDPRRQTLPQGHTRPVSKTTKLHQSFKI